MKIYFVENGTTLVDGKGYVKMTDARKVQKACRDQKTTKLDKQVIVVKSLEINL